MRQIMTIGYEGAKLDDFLSTLLAQGVELLLDVREVAISRKKGFSKTALSEAVTSHGIQYLHLRDLGDPKPGREAARRGDIAEFQRIFSEHLETEKAKAGLSTISSLLEGKNVCLLCYERDHKHCHRTLIVEALGEVKVRHLGVHRARKIELQQI